MSQDAAKVAEIDRYNDGIARQPIDSAPKDGTVIYVGDPDVGEFPMQWGTIQRNGLFPGVVGMWVMSDGSMTWNDADDCGPTTWRHLP
jgi:hypothetical protein